MFVPQSIRPPSTVLHAGVPTLLAFCLSTTVGAAKESSFNDRARPSRNATVLESSDAGPKDPSQAPPQRSWLGRVSFGAMHLQASGAGTVSGEALAMDLSGAGLSGDMEFAWPVAPALYFGVSLGLNVVETPKMRFEEHEGELPDSVLTSYRLGPTLTYYFGGDRGLYAHGFAGLTTMQLKLGEGDSAIKTPVAVGPGVSASIGYDLSISAETSFGISLYGLWARVSQETDDVKEQFSILSPGLLVSLTLGKARRSRL